MATEKKIKIGSLYRWKRDHIYLGVATRIEKAKTYDGRAAAQLEIHISLIPHLSLWKPVLDIQIYCSETVFFHAWELIGGT